MSAPVLTRICAWCPDFDPTAVVNKLATHVICDTCRMKLEAQLG